MSKITRSLPVLFLLLAVQQVIAGDNPVMEGYDAFKEEEYERAFELWQEPARAGNARAQFFLSVMYAEGIGVTRDPLRALYLLKDAAAGGLRTAQFDLGMRYQQGRGVEKSESAGAYWLSRAAHNGLAKAQFNLGALYFLGKGMEQNRHQAVYWYRRAANNGSDQARSALERMGEPVQLSESLEMQPASTAPVLVGESPGDAGEKIYPQNNKAEKTNKNKRFKIVSKVRNKIDDALSAETQHGDAVPGDDREWILAQPAYNYSIQVAASDKMSEINQFKAGLELPDRLSVYTYMQSGKSYYGVIYGNYASLEEAEKVLASLPDSVLRKGPWARSFNAIRGIMDLESKID